MRKWTIGCVLVTLFSIYGCGKDDKTSAQRDADVKKVLQQGADMEKKMYEGMQKGVENVEKSVKDQKEK